MEPNACTNGSAEVGRKLKRGCAAHDALGSVKEGLCGRDRDGETFGRRAGLLGRTWMHEAMGCSPTECVPLSRQSQQCHTAAVDYGFCYPVNRSFIVCHPLTS